MSNKKLKQTDNIENLCPTTRKRIKTTPVNSWKLAKLESNSSPSTLTTEYLEEMGIEMLDSEESSSSAASSIALVLSASADENSNGVTPNLDAPKMCHHRVTSYRPLDNTLDSTLSSDNNTLTGSPNISQIETEDSTTNKRSNQNNSGVLDAYSDESKQTQIQGKNGDKVLPQYRKVAILGVGAGIIGSSLSTSAASASQTNNSNSNSNSPSAGISTRSPLATVSSNNHNRTTRNFPNQQITSGNSAASINNVTNAHYSGSSNSLNPATALHAPNYTAMPSTSKQQNLFKQQHRQQFHQKQMQLAAEQQTHMALYDNFFLYRQQQLSNFSDGQNHFDKLSDEILLQIFKWLPKKTLIRCSYICRRFNRCASDESLWTRLDLGGRHLRTGALGDILPRGVVILRLAQAQLNDPVFDSDFLHAQPKFESKLQYLDLSMASIRKPSIKMLLARCRQLKKLSLEHVSLNDEICDEIAKNTNLEALNLAMCLGLEAWSLRKITESLQNLNSLNISWTLLSVDAVTAVVTNVTPNLMRLNMAGCRKTMYDSHVAILAERCPQLLEIDLSDCTSLTGNAISIICRFKMLEYLSLSRCYLIPATSYMEISNLPTLKYLDIFGMLSDNGMQALEKHFSNIGINKFIHSSVARPTVGTRRTSIWGLRTRE